MRAWSGLGTTIAVFIFVHCSGTSTEQLLGGQFGNLDSTPPTVISPADGTKIKGLSASLAWATKAGASRYNVEIASDAAFTQPIAGSPFLSDTSSLIVQLPDAYTYYWRVRANTTAAGKYSAPTRVHMLGDAILVYCPSAQSTCSNSGKTGNKSSPYESIQESLAEAKTLGVEVHVAARGGTAYYNEPIILVSSIQLKGGYSASDWSRNIDANITEIKHSAATTVYASYLSLPAALVEGFSITNQNSGVNYVFYVEGTSALRIERNTIKPGTGAGGGTMAYGVYCSSSSPIIKENVILGGTALSGNYAIYAYTNAAPIVFRNILIGGSASGYGFYSTSGTAIVAENWILAGNSANATGVEDSASSRKPIAALNIVHGGNGSTKSVALSAGTGNYRFFQNTIDTGNAPTAYGVYVSTNGASNPIVDANAFYHSGGGSSVYGVYEASALQSPLNVRRNLFALENGLKVYFDNFSTDLATVCTADGKPATTATSCTGTNVNAAGGSTSGNKTTPLISDIFYRIPTATLFTSDGPDAGSTYDGTISRLEIATQVACNNFNINEYFEYFPWGQKQVTAKDCTAATSFIDFTSALITDYGRFTPIILWGSNYPVTAPERFSAKSTAPVLNQGFQCPGEMESATHVWGPATSQVECDQRYPHHNSTYNGGNCQTTFLYPAVQIDPTLTVNSRFHIPVAGNGLCEPGETCLFNPNIGAYPGHGNLVAAGCDLSGVASGIFSSVNLLKYQTNGY